MRHFTLIAGVSSLILASPLAAATFLITPDGTGDAPDIQTAVTACVDGDVIELADGVYTGANNRDVDFEGKAITVCSQNRDPDLVVIEVGGTLLEPHRGFVFHSGEGSKSILEAITVTGGVAPPHGFDRGQNGGAVLCCGSSPTIVNCVFRYNEAAGSGGALATCDSASPRVTSTVFHGNYAARAGGAVSAGHIAHPVFDACVFSGNFAGLEGGALAVTTGASVALTACELYANEAVLGGVLRQVTNTHTTFTDCTFVRNIGRAGVFHVVGASSSEVSGSTLYGNISEHGPSGFLVTGDGELVLSRSILAFGHGRAVEVGDAGDNRAFISCTDIYGNEGGDWTADIAGQRKLRGNLSADPLFCDVDAGDFSLAYNSPCRFGFCGGIGAHGNGCGLWDVYDDELDTVGRMSDVDRTVTRGSVAIRFSVPDDVTPSISVHDVSGRAVRTYTASSARGTWIWDGKMESGIAAAPGVYFVRVTAGGRHETNRVLVLR